MANINRQITLTGKGADAGPYFDVYYSTDCINYTICVDGTAVYLPLVGSTVIVTVPDNAACLKLVNRSPECNGNNVIESIGTTTTTACPPCISYELVRNANPASVTYIDCYGVQRIESWSSGVIRRICAKEILESSNASIGNLGNCGTLPIGGLICGTGSFNNCDCNNNTIRINGVNTQFVYYLDCETGEPQATMLSYFTPVSLTDCMVSGSIIVPQPTVFTLTKNSDCDCVTTTTTTQAPTTTTTTTGGTTTTTTAGPTTTTTTFSSDPCICTEVVITSAGGEVQTFNCYGANQNYVYPSAGTYYICAASIGGLLQAFFAEGTTGTITPAGNCKTGPCPSITTTTTTAAPTTTTTTQTFAYKVELCGGGEGPYVVTRAGGTAPSGIGQAFKLVKPGTPFDGIKCWEVIENPSTDPIDYTNVAFANVFSNCAECNATTTTTTTQAPTTTTTTAATTTTTTLSCVTSVSFDVDSAGDVRYVDCCGNTIYLTLGIGPQVINDCLQNGSLFGVGATISSISYSGTGCSCVTTTTTTTTPPSSTWTVSNYDCGFGTLNDVGINGSFMNSLSGPSTFPLTSTLYGMKYNPSGINYGSTNTIQANVTTNLPGTGNCAVARVVVNGTTTYETYFTSDPFPQVSGVVIPAGATVSAYVQCYPGPCPGTTTTTTAAPTTTTTTAAGATLDWSYTTGGGASGNMIIYLNGNIIENRTYDATGTWPVNVGDTINVEMSSTGCSGGNNYANVYTLGIITDAACNISSTSMTTGVYTVTSGDIGTTLNLDTFATCDGGCV